MLSSKNKVLTDEQMQKMAFKQANAENNRYYDKFKACKKSWIIGHLIGLALATPFCFGGGNIGETILLCVLVFIMGGSMASGVCGIIFTREFGMSWMIRFAIPMISGVWNIFCGGSFVTIGVAIVLYLILVFVLALPFCLFAIVFPLEVLYYAIRYSIEKKRIYNSEFKNA